MAGLTCDCKSPTGFSNLGLGYDIQWWVHSECGRPTEPWFAAQGDDMLNFFRGGPLDGSAYATSTLLESAHGREEWSRQVSEYVWTPEVVTSERTGASARVWVHHTQAPQNPQQHQQPAAAAAVTTAAAGQSSPAPTQEGATMAKNTEQTLEDRRKAGGFSRNQVAEASGLTVSKVYRIEKGGARTTEEEVATLTAGLEKLEAAAATSSPE